MSFIVNLNPHCDKMLPLFAYLASTVLLLQVSTGNTDTWPFEVERDTFSESSLLDLRYLNETVAGETGWIGIDEAGDFVRGDGASIRFWAVGTGVKESGPREQPGWERQYLDHQARWFAKRGVNMVRTHAFINPQVSGEMTDVKTSEVEWIWKVIGTMKQQGIYTTVSPYWANSMKSDDEAWGLDWQGQHHGLLFFEEPLIEAYKSWLKYLFTTPTEYLDGKTLAEEPAMAIFQIQNEDSLLFWTVNNLKPGQAKRLGKLFGDWAIGKYGSLDATMVAWDHDTHTNDDPESGILGFENIWNLTGGAAMFENKRLADQLQFWVEQMRRFNESIAQYVREELNCPVLINAGNWKTADTVYLNDSERYSYTTNEVQAVNRYFNGMYVGPNAGWAIVEGDFFTNKSVVGDGALDFPINLKQLKGSPMLVTESTWVYPMETGFEAPLLIAAYGALNGTDGYYWFSSGVDDYEPPRSANGYLKDSQTMWLCMNPELAGQWPGAALLYRTGLVSRGQTVVEEHRSLESLWHRDFPMIAETSSFDPNRDEGNGSDPDSEDELEDNALPETVSPWSFFIGPVEVVYDSNEADASIVENLQDFYKTTETGTKVTSITGELALDTGSRLFELASEGARAVIGYDAFDMELQGVRIVSSGGQVAVTLASMDGLSIEQTAKLLVQVGTPSRPYGWVQEGGVLESEKGEYEGIYIRSVGKAPWMVKSSDLSITFQSMPTFDKGLVLDMNGNPVAELSLTTLADSQNFHFPKQAMYVVLMRDLD